MKISKRLIQVANTVTPGNKVTDIGTDHGYVPIYLIKNKLADYVIAMDVNIGPLKRAEENIKEYGYGDYIETRLSNGFEKIKPKEADVAVIAGMGGELIKKILIQGKDVVDELKELVLSPHSEVDVVRKYLHESGFRIVNEEMLIDEGKFYSIIKAEKGIDKEYSETEYKYGAVLIEKKDVILEEFLLNKLNKYKVIQKHIKEEKSKKSLERLNEIEVELKEIEGILEGF